MSSNSVKFFMLLNPTHFTSIQRRNSIAYVGKGARKHNHFSESRSLVSFSVKKSVGIRNQISTSEDFDGTLAVEAGSQLKSPWIEWLNLVDYLRSETYLEQVEVQEDILTSLRVPKEFVTVAKSALLFSHKNPDLLWSLSKRDIMIVVDNVSPFMFKNGPQSIRRMKSFLDGSGKDITFQNLDSDKPTTVDLMSFLLSFACNYFYSVEQNSVKNGVLVEESVRSLLNHIIDIKRTVSKNDSSSGSTSFGKSVEMKRGDWICLKCNFMNFAKNMKCLQCNEQRPKRKLTGSEWDCPQCDFYNYGRNVACLRCNCKHPINGSNFESKVETWSSRNTSTDKNSSSSISQSLDKILSPTTSFGLSTNTSESNNGSGSLESSSTSRRGFANEHNDSGYVPFVPLSADMFAKSQKKVEPVENTTTSNETGKGLSSSKIENQALDNNEVQSDTSEKWFNKVTETQDKTDLVNPMSDDDFPEIMPIRKGENRFVISKKKDRSLTSPQYKRRLAMEEAHNSNFVPFLPFPPGYFAKKDNQNEKDKEVPASTNPSASEKPAAVSEKQENELVIENSTSYSRGDNETSSLRKDTNVATTSVPQTENQEKVYARKSLEGSLVKEPDPLDMSEEAKAERWFRRVAQIKDISELSQIPDEDFPQIMPMRKGVNRFVVSKRKTPLERRLTSQQYRRNAPIVTSDPEKQSN